MDISGIKLSTEWVQYDIPLEPPQTTDSTSRLLAALTEVRINVTYLAVAKTGRSPSASLCVAVEDAKHADTVINAVLGRSARVRRISAVGGLTAFPHRSNLGLMGALMACFDHHDLPLYGIASSIASITVNTDYNRLDEAVAALLQRLRLPDGHAPLRPEFKIKQLT